MIRTALILLIFTLAAGYGFSQTIEATILDAKSKKPIAYATVFNTSTSKGTVSNTAGFFRLSYANISDSIVITFIGYNSINRTVEQLRNLSELKLERKALELTEFVVLGDRSVLIDALHRAKKNNHSARRTAKTYYSLESYAAGRQVEMLESYYNGEYSGYDVKRLNLKNGRIALAEHNKRFFVSTETSKAIYHHKLFDHNIYFPKSPFDYSRFKLKKVYDLHLENSYYSEDDNKILVIGFTPIDSNLDAFSGTIWLDSNTAEVLKINYQIQDAKSHPFLPTGNIRTLDRVDLDLTKTFTTRGTHRFVESIHFNYQMHYTTAADSTLRAETKAVLYAYNDAEIFDLPHFEFTEGRYADYLKINAAPYNAAFWQNTDEFSMNDVQNKNQMFIQRDATLTDQSMFHNKDYFKKGILEHPYMQWSNQRINLSSAFQGPKERVTQNAWQGTIPSTQYNISVKLYMDVNVWNGKVHYLTATIFDPFETFYKLQVTPVQQAFINMYFDVMEIERRKMELELKKFRDDKEKVVEVFEFYQEKSRKVGERFLDEVDRGNNPVNMFKWNEVINDYLGIDNIGLFEIRDQLEADVVDRP